MSRNQFTTTKRLTANDVYELISTVLPEYVELDMSRSKDEHRVADHLDFSRLAVVQS